jgi:hypothetical protein
VPSGPSEATWSAPMENTTRTVVVSRASSSHGTVHGSVVWLELRSARRGYLVPIGSYGATDGIESSSWRRRQIAGSGSPVGRGDSVRSWGADERAGIAKCAARPWRTHSEVIGQDACHWPRCFERQAAQLRRGRVLGSGPVDAVHRGSFGRRFPDSDRMCWLLILGVGTRLARKGWTIGTAPPRRSAAMARCRIRERGPRCVALSYSKEPGRRVSSRPVRTPPRAGRLV